MLCTIELSLLKLICGIFLVFYLHLGLTISQGAAQMVTIKVKRKITFKF